MTEIDEGKRRIAAHHEAGHAVAMLANGVTPDGAAIDAGGNGKVHSFCRPQEWEAVLQTPELRRMQAVIAMAGPVAEMDYRGEPVEFQAVGGDTGDLRTVAELGFGRERERYDIQIEALDLLRSHPVAHWWIARLLLDLGVLHRDDLAELWRLHRGA